MNRPSDTRNSSGSLPSFLSPNADGTSEAQATTVDSEDAATNYEDAESEVGDDEDYDYDEDVVDEEDEEDEEEAYDAPVAAAPRTTRRRGQFQSVPLAGGMTMTLGAALTITGLVTAALPAATAALAAVIAPPTITLLGLAVFAIGTSQRRTSRVQRRLQALETERSSVDDELRDTLAQILQEQSGQGANGAEADDAQQLMLSLQRQDQKINNLTKAIKMYGKPLMDISGQGTEIAGSVAQVKALVEGAAETTRQGVNRVEQLVRTGGGKTDLGDLPGQIEKLQVSLEAMSQRIEDTEVRKSLVRVEDATKQLATQLESLQRGENVKAATNELQQSLDQATTGLQKGLQQMREGNLTGLETSVKDIQRELAGLATSMSQVQAAVKNGAQVATSAPQAAAAAPAAPTATATTSSANTSNHAAPAAANGGNAASGDKDGSGYTTGERKSGGKNVLGAIAKLKSMKG
ncbi:MAG: putative nucleic acid-binding Zn-ribbon protein [Planctomycetota bacterium]|jgi:predicted  nucleic acid-binding Zn-ribbon protein